VKLLLDTHIWIWSLSEPSKIDPRIEKALKNPANEKWLSPISVWEFRTLVEKGRLKSLLNIEETIVQAMAEFPLKEAPLTTEVVLAMGKIHLPHRDPADAFLAATAIVFDLTLVTADARLRTAKGVSFL
jgi:PIN domain nuclease of toxin-antitoxin system